MGVSREGLVKNLWPDKILYGCLLLFVAGLLGATFALVRLVLPVGFADEIPAILQQVPALLTLVLSLATVVGGYLAWRRVDAPLGVGAALAGVASLGLVGLTSVFSAIALGFLLWAIREGEHESEYTSRMEAHMWPDKALAASLLSLMNGVVLVVWGIAIAAGRVDFTMIAGQPVLFGLVAALLGVGCVAAARRLYDQRGARLGAVAALASFAGVGLYVVGPLLAVGTLAAIGLALREEEFEPAGRGQPG